MRCGSRTRASYIGSGRTTEIPAFERAFERLACRYRAQLRRHCVENRPSDNADSGESPRPDLEQVAATSLQQEASVLDPLLVNAHGALLDLSGCL